MKLRIALAFTISMLGLGGTVSAAPSGEDTKPAPSFLSTVIDNVPVPYDVLIYAQMKYQGHAVTEVKQISLSDRQVYQLRVDDDDVLNDYTGIHLIYDTGWNLLDQKKLTPPPPVVVPEQEDEEDEPKPQKPDNDNTEEKEEKVEEKEDIEENRRNPGNTTEDETEDEDAEEDTTEEKKPNATGQNDDAANTEESA
ncbi:hypothetical protein KY385_02050 [Candidatus Parcubacteria bacterium]|nr:hypothetical protein [Candidatus Parcubacteria bacterium]